MVFDVNFFLMEKFHFNFGRFSLEFIEWLLCMKQYV